MIRREDKLVLHQFGLEHSSWCPLDILRIRLRKKDLRRGESGTGVWVAVCEIVRGTVCKIEWL